MDKLTDLAATAPAPAHFYQELIDTLRELTGAKSIALWSVEGQNYRLQVQHGLNVIEIEREPSLEQLHSSGLAEVCQETTKLVEKQTPHDTYTFFACRCQNEVFLVIELVYERATVEPASRGLLEAIEEIVSDYHQASMLRLIKSRQTALIELNDLIQRINSAASIHQMAYEIVNEVRRFVDCDRVSLVRFERGSCRTLAVSAVATIDPRSQQLRSLEQLAATVLPVQSRWSYSKEREEPPQRAGILHEYLDHSGSQSLEIIGLGHNVQSASTDRANDSRDEIGLPTNVLGGLIQEQFTLSAKSSEQEYRQSLIVPHIESAFRRAVELDQLPLLKLSYGLRSWTDKLQRRGLRWLTIAGVILGLLAVTLLIPAELNIVATGVFQPEGWKHVYAPLPGEIVNVLVDHQSQVKEGQVLLRLRNRELELKKQELFTQRNVSLEKLRAIEATRLGGRRPQSTDAPSALELSASERELEETVDNLDRQLSIVEQMLQTLEIKSPLAGQVVSWDTASSLEQRPVQQGQRLLSLASNVGSGRLQLFVPDTDVQHVVKAQSNLSSQADRKGVSVTFSIATDPSVKHQATIERIGTIVESSASLGPRVRLEARVDSGQLAGSRPGATVVARIHCGRSNLAYVWLRRLWEGWLLWIG